MDTFRENRLTLGNCTYAAYYDGLGNCAISFTGSFDPRAPRVRPSLAARLAFARLHESTTVAGAARPKVSTFGDKLLD